MFRGTIRSDFRFAFTLLSIVVLAGTLGAQSGAPTVAPHSLIPSEFRGLTAAQLNSRALAQHKAGDYSASGQLFFYATLAAPNEARGHFNLACVFALQRQDSAAAAELRRAMELDRKWTLANLDDPDLDDIRQGVAYSDFISWFTGTRGLPTGEWGGGSRTPLAGQKFPSWLKGTEAESDAFDESRLVIDASSQVVLSLGTSPRRYSFRGRATVDGSVVTLDGWTRRPDDQGQDREVPALCLLTLRRLAPDILRVDVLLDFTTGKDLPLTEYLGRVGPSTAPLDLPPSPRDNASRLPADLAGKSAAQLMAAAEKAGSDGDGFGAVRLAWWAGVLEPGGWRSHLAAARWAMDSNFGYIVTGAVALHELGLALRAVTAVDRAGLLSMLDDPGFDRLRRLPGWSELLLAGLPSVSLAGSWAARDIDDESLPRWVSREELAPAANSLTVAAGRFSLSVAAGFNLAAAMEPRGGGWYWAGTRSDEGPPQSVGGILQMRLLAPNWMEVTSLVSSADWANIIHGVYRRQEDSRR